MKNFKKHLGILAVTALLIVSCSSDDDNGGTKTPSNNYTNVVTFAGQADTAGDDDGIGTLAEFNEPWSMDFDSAGNLYVCDFKNKKIRKIAPDGTVTTFADGVFDAPSGIVIDNNNNVYVSDRDLRKIFKITPDGIISDFAGGGTTADYINATGTTARFASLYSLTMDADQNIYVADRGNKAIRKITPAAEVTTVLKDDMEFTAIVGLVYSNGDLYATDIAEKVIYKVTLETQPQLSVFGDGIVSNLNTPYNIDVDADGNFFIVDFNNFQVLTVAVNSAGEASSMTVLAGSTDDGSVTNGTLTEAKFKNPIGITVADNGDLYISDLLGHTIRKIEKQQ